MALMNRAYVVLAALFCSAAFETYVMSEKSNAPEMDRRQLWKVCADELGFDIGDAKASGVPFEKWYGCVLKKIGVITEEGTFSYEKALEDIKDLTDNAETQEHLEEILKKCNEEVSSTERTEDETTVIVVDCFKQIGDVVIKYNHRIEHLKYGTRKRHEH